jgi:rieske iron-sulfur protein
VSASNGDVKSVNRRFALKAICVGVGLGVAPRLSFAQGTPAASPPQVTPAASPPQVGDLLVRAEDESPNPTPLAPEDVAVATNPLIVWPMDPASKTVRKDFRNNELLLMRFDPATYSPETLAVSVAGVVAYSSLCTHSGCEVTDWVADRGAIECLCHAAFFDPRGFGKVIEGPCITSLPALPLKVVDGKLVVAGPFVHPIHFDEI